MRASLSLRVAALLCGSSCILFAMATACEPQDIYLFDGATSERRVDGGTSEPPISPPQQGQHELGDRAQDAGEAPNVQPDCESEACVTCIEQSSCSPAVTVLLCHPGTGSCSLPCDADAPFEQTGCPSVERCDARFGLCVECVLDTDCGDIEPICDRRSGSCVECVLDSDCPAERSACDGATSRCVECDSAEDCGASGEVCLLVEQRCVQCQNDGDCAGFDDIVRCLPGEQRCVECIDDDDCNDPERPICSGERECED